MNKERLVGAAILVFMFLAGGCAVSYEFLMGALFIGVMLLFLLMAGAAILVFCVGVYLLIFGGRKP